MRSDRARQAPRARRAVAAVAVLALLTGVHPALAAPPVPDAGAAKRPTVDTAPNGKPIVQITDPSAGGVSRNRYTRFDVDPGGLILNNSTSFAKTQLGGYIAGNPNLSRSASVILNEVTGTAPSLLAGYLEVAGQKAEVVVANPNGLTCSGCGFINVSRGTLTTGTPVFGGAGTLDAFRVVGGNISIEGAGLEASGVDQVDLLSRTLHVNAGIWAQRLEVVTGANQIWRDDLSVEPLTPSGAAPEVSLDVGALGGMYAGRIRLVGTEKGVGVTSAGKLASTGDFTLRADGKIVFGGETTAGGELKVASNGDVQNGAVLYGTSLLEVTAGGAVTNTGLMASRDATHVTAARITSPGTIAAGVTQAQELTAPGSLTLETQPAGAIDVTGGKLLAGGALEATGDTLALSGAAVQAKGDLTLAATGGDVMATDARIESGGALVLTAPGAVAVRGATLLGTTVGVGADTIDLARGAGKTSVSAVSDLTLHADSRLVAADATLHTRGALSASAGGTLDAAGADVSAESAELRGGTLLLDGASVQTSGWQELVATGLLGAYGATLKAGGHIEAQAADQLDAGASTITGSSIGLTGASVNLADAGGNKGVHSAGTLHIEATQAGIDTSRAQVTADGFLDAQAATTFLNGGGQVDGHGVRIRADEIVSSGAQAHIASAGELELYAPSAVRNVNGSILYASGNVWIGVQETDGSLGYTRLLVNDSASFIESGGENIIHADNTQGPAEKGLVVAGQPLTGVSVPPPTDPPSATLDLQFTLPSGGIFHVNRDPGHPLVESDPRFTDFKTFLTSDYMLSRLPSTPESSLKRLGDGYYEEQLVLDQLALLTGRSFLNQYTEAQQQYQALMDQGVQVAKAMQLSVGVKLTDDQVARLTAPMVWMVKVNVGGQDVLVPKVYVPAAQAVALQKRGAIVAGTDLVLSTKSDVVLSDNLRAGRSVSVTAGSITAAAGSTYSTAKDLELVADRDIDLTATHLQAGGDLTLHSTGGNIDVGVQSTDTGVLQHAFGKSNRDVTVAGSSIAAGGDVRIMAGNAQHSGGSVRLTGTSILSSGGGVTLLADKDIELRAAEQRHEAFDGTGRQTGGTVTHVLTTIDAPTLPPANGNDLREAGKVPAGSVAIIAGRDATLEGVQVATGGSIQIQADRNVSLTTVKDSVLKESGTYGKKYERTYDEKSKGELTAEGGVSIWATGEAPAGEAGTGKVTTQGTSITANGGAVFIQGKEISLGTAREEHDSLRTDHKSKSGFLSTKDTFTRDEVKADVAVGTALTGAAVVVKSDGDLKIQGAQIGGGGDVLIQAGKKLDILAAEDHVVEQHLRVVSTDGVLGMSKLGIGVVIGGRREETQTDVDAVLHEAALVGSVEGGLTVDAQGAVTILGSNLLSKEAMSVKGATVTIGKVDDVEKTDTVVKTLQDGISVGFRNGAVDSARSAYEAAKRGSEVKDDRLKALYALRAVREANEVRKELASNKGDYKNGSINVGMTQSVSRSETKTESRTAVGSLLQSDGDVSVVARGDATGEQGDLTVIGSRVQGKDVTLDAARDLKLLSAENRLDEGMESWSYSGEVGGSGTWGKGGKAIGFHAAADGSYSRSDSHDVTHTQSAIDASGQLTLKSGGDMTLRGATAKGDSLVATVGGNLTIESEQDRSTYHSSDLSGHVEGTYGMGWSASATVANATMESSYRSVQQQSGLFAGKGGYDIRVEGNTDLKGGVIASEAEKSKNKLDTGTLTYSNLENKSEYTALSGSITGTIGSGGGVSGSGGVPIHGNKQSTTLAVISPGELTIRHGSQDVSTLSRDPAHAANTIGNIFDRASIEERKELVDVFGQEAYKAVGDLAQHFTKPYTDAQLQEKQALYYKDLLGKGDALTDQQRQDLKYLTEGGFTPESVDKTIQVARDTQREYQEQYETWKDGSPAKTALHAAVGAMQAGLAGGSVLAGAAGAGASERLSEVTAKLPSAIKPFASLVVGTVAAGLTGASGVGALTGGATADYGAKFNRDLHASERERLKKLAAENYADLGFKDKSAAEDALLAVACSMVHCANEMDPSQNLGAPTLALQGKGDGLRVDHPDLEVFLRQQQGTFQDKWGRTVGFFQYSASTEPGLDIYQANRGTRAEWKIQMNQAQRYWAEKKDALLAPIIAAADANGRASMNYLDAMRAFEGGELGAFGPAYRDAYLNAAAADALTNDIDRVNGYVDSMTTIRHKVTLDELSLWGAQDKPPRDTFNGVAGAVLGLTLALRGLGMGPAVPPEPMKLPEASTSGTLTLRAGAGTGTRSTKLTAEQIGNMGENFELESTLKSWGAKSGANQEASAPRVGKTPDLVDPPIIGEAAAATVERVAGTRTGRFASEPQLLDHFGRHAADFGATSPADYEAMADRFLTGDLPPGALEKVRPNGDVVRYNPVTEEFGVLKSGGATIRTYYVPDPAVHGYPSNLEYFHAQ
jgi:filamentous hemagglutinin